MSSTYRLRVAVIGAGASGLSALKTCLEEGFEPVCFERKDHVGGLWNYSETVQDGQSTVMKTTVSNTSKEMSAFSDFPMPQHYPNFLPHRYAREYLKRYAASFDLNRHIRFNAEVTEVRRANDYDETGKWVVNSRSKGYGKTNSSVDELYDAVLVCSGHHGEKHMPDLPGLKRFRGRILHVHDYRPDPSFDGKNVLVVGMGNSAGDVAVELSRQANQVYLSTRRGSWIMQLLMTRGMPPDLCLMTRFEHWQNSVLPSSWAGAKLAAMANRCVDHDLYAMTPETGHAPFVSDELIGRIACGSIQVRGDVRHIVGRGVRFLEGDFKDVDVIVLATGYRIGFPFLDEQVFTVKDNRIKLYKQIFPLGLSHHTLAFIGCFQLNGCTWPASEMQSRVAAGVFAGTIQLPSRDKMLRNIKSQRALRVRRYPDTLRHTIEVDYMTFMEDLARIVGCKPSVGRLLFTDPELAVSVLFGPCIPAQYRIHGPRQWIGARRAVLQTMDRVRYPLETRDVPTNTRRLKMKVAEWIMFPPAAWTLFLEVVVAFLLLVLLVVC